MNRLKIFCLTLIGLILLSSGNILAESDLARDLPRDLLEFISFGADLTTEQRSQLYNRFAPQRRPQIIEITNQEEKAYLRDYIPQKQIGSKAISSVYLRLLKPNSGIHVETEKITWVTTGMYANAVVTAGIKDVLIKVSSPFLVSGTAALTGIFKTFELAQGQPINQERKGVSYQELVTTGELGEDIGQDNAERLVREVKREVVEREITAPEEIEVIIKQKTKEYNIKITAEQMQQIILLMEEINRLDLNIEEITEQLQNLNTKVQGMERSGQRVVGLLAQIVALFRRLLDFILDLFGR